MPSSFFEKLKKGMGIEGQLEETEEETEPAFAKASADEEKARKKKTPRPKNKLRETEMKPIKTQFKKLELETPEIKKGEIKEEKVEITFNKEEVPEKLTPAIEEAPVEEKVKEDKPSHEDKPSFEEGKSAFAKASADEGKWSPLGGEPEGELAIDVYQTETNLIIQTAIAGIKPENLDISMERDIIAIKGIRQKPFEEEGDYFTQECFWGPFSREVILPVEVDPDRAEATMKDGILTIRIPKILRERKRVIKVRI